MLDSVEYIVSEPLSSLFPSTPYCPLLPSLISIKSFIQTKDLREEVMQTLCNLVLQMGADYNIFVPMVGKVLSKYGIMNSTYDTLIARLLKNQPLVPEAGSDDATVATPTKHPESTSDDAAAISFSNSSLVILSTSFLTYLHAQDAGVKKLKVNEQSLKKAWEASQRSTKEDWAEWIRRFSVELLRESPSPALRSCLALVQDYPPLVRELFNAGFVSICFLWVCSTALL